MTTFQELAERVGTRGLARVNSGMKVAVTILDFRRVYGRTEYKVAPVQGTGTTWFSESALTFEGDRT